MKILKSFSSAIILTILATETTVEAAPDADADALDTININFNLEGATGSVSGCLFLFNYNVYSKADLDIIKL